jgi:formate-dependent nitrite reductase cytochrome c552 subunit
MCHTNAFGEWETSKHAANNIDCYDCHKAHTQGLRIEPQEKLCAACHSDTQTEAAHSIHGISGVDCASCHMAPQMKETAATDGVTLSMSNHSFAVASDVCVRCHTDSAHKADQAMISSGSDAGSTREARQLELQTRRVSELEGQVNAQMKRVDDLRNIAVVGMALAFGVGGFCGLVLGVGGTALFGRRKPQ